MDLNEFEDLQKQVDELSQQLQQSQAQLLQLREKRPASYEAWNRLDQAGTWIVLHGGNQAVQSFRRHDAVGVENNEIRISCAEVLDPVAYVARLLAFVRSSPANVDLNTVLVSRAQLPVGSLLQQSFRRVLRVAQDEYLEAVTGTDSRKVPAHGVDQSSDLGSVLAIDWK